MTPFNQILQQLFECDGSIGLFEYTLMKMVTRQLRAHFDGPNLDKPLYGRVRDVLPECALLLSALAHVGNEDESDARAAFAEGAEFLDAPGAQPQFLTRSEWDLAAVDAALTKLAGYHEPLRRNVLLACGKTVDRRRPGDRTRSRTAPRHRRFARLPAAAVRGNAARRGTGKSLVAADVRKPKFLPI